MNREDVQVLLTAFDQSSASVFELTCGEFSLYLEKPQGEYVAVEQPMSHPKETKEVAATIEPAMPTDDYEPFLAPLAGTYYKGPSEDAPSFVKVGDYVAKGDTIAIIEAMKVMNEVPAPVSGRVVEIFARNGQVVGYNDVLMKVAVDV